MTRRGSGRAATGWALAAALLGAQGCSTRQVAILPIEVPKLGAHDETGEVVVTTTEGKRVGVGMGRLRYVLLTPRSESEERRLRPPFSASVGGNRLSYTSEDGSRGFIELSDLEEARVVRDDWLRLPIVLGSTAAAIAAGFGIGYFAVSQTCTETEMHDDCDLGAFMAGTFGGLIGLSVALPMSVVLTRDLPER